MDDSKQKFSEVVEWLEKEFTGIRTGQATPAILDGVKVEVYGSHMPIVQVASVGIEDARTLRVSPWDNSTIAAIEKAITEANLGLSVVTDSGGLRVVFPELTSDRREQLRKIAKTKLEDARISVRSIRDDYMKQIEKDEKAGEISEDEMRGLKDGIQKQVDQTNKTLEERFTQKEQEITQ